MIERVETATVGEIVARNFRAAAVFERFGIDFCCGGRRSIADACQQARVDPGLVVAELDALSREAPEDDVTQWSIDEIVDHIVSHHHAYVRSAWPAISQHLAKLVRVHGERHSELARVAAHLDQMARDLEQHLLKEEYVLFPYVRQLSARHELEHLSPFGSVQNPIRMMEQEHREAVDALRLIRELTNDYTPPADGCPTYAACMADLEQFERDLHRHVHLENNVLFPKAVALERALCRA